MPDPRLGWEGKENFYNLGFVTDRKVQRSGIFARLSVAGESPNAGSNPAKTPKHLEAL